MKNLSRLIRGLIYILPFALFFSYYPLISFGSNESMNFELSVSLLWLLVFDAVAFCALVCERRLFKELKGKWGFILFPLWLTVSVIWSLNMVRGVLTVSILWLLMFAGYGIWSLREVFKDEKFRKLFNRWFFGSTIVVCLWCFIQCVLDLAGVSQAYSLLCDGCTYHMFGFPHPNGFAIEPQFMGNLLLAPVFVIAGLFLSDHGGKKVKRERFCCFAFLLLWVFVLITLFLTFSRGAIYAFMAGMMVMSVWIMVQEKKKRKGITKKIGVTWGMVVLAFVIALNIQGLMAEMSPTTDTYGSGIAKVLNHLSLGVIDVGANNLKQMQGEVIRSDMEIEAKDDVEPKEEGLAVEKIVENSVDSSVENSVELSGENAVFDGYVAESTDARLRLSGAALRVWKKDFGTAVIGVGLGGAGQALYNNELSPAPKEIVQNQYASILLETGLIGMILFILVIVLMVRAILKNPVRILLMSLVIAYGITLCFFSGLPNALQIYLMPMVIAIVYGWVEVKNYKGKRKKLVS